MRVQIVNPETAAGLRDPHTRRQPFIDPETKTVIAIAEVPESTFWVRRILAGELVRVADDPAPAPPRGNEPVVPLTTRGSK